MDTFRSMIAFIVSPRLIQQKNKKREDKGKGPRDPDAKWGVKHKRKAKTPEGKEIEQTDYFYGFKAHVSMNAETGLISSVEIISGEAYDGHHFCSLVDKDLEQSLPLETYASDRGYDDSNNHFYLVYKDLHSAIRLKENRIKKKDKNKEVWLNLIQTACRINTRFHEIWLLADQRLFSFFGYEP